jgi:hypothetical protein
LACSLGETLCIPNTTHIPCRYSLNTDKVVRYGSLSIYDTKSKMRSSPKAGFVPAWIYNPFL